MTNPINRRTLMRGAALAGAAGLSGCAGGDLPPGRLEGADVARGHRLRKNDFPAPTRTETTDIVIAGGGVAGLSAAWRLVEAGFDQFRLLELEDETGGNARAGRNAVSAYPLGAHYLPVPNREAKALRLMLRQAGLITGEQPDGAPVYDPYALCADPQERIFWNGKWQEGLIPHMGLSAVEQDELKAFAGQMGEFSKATGSDGKPAFAIPMAYSSSDAQWLALDAISMSRWLDQQGWTSPALRRHVRYCCRDDFGTEPEHVSAWAGIHYFAARRGWGAGDSGDNELTWPEGNAWLAHWLAGRAKSRISSGRTVFAGRRGGEGISIDSFDTATGASVRTTAKAAILATPHFITARLMPELGSAKRFSYAPWLVANVTVDRRPAGRGALLAWDNVSGASESLGYVVATHQTASRPGPTVLTWYMPLSRQSPADARKDLLARPAEHWQAMVRDDLLAMNPDLKGAIRRIDLWRWGHAMIRPEPGFLFGTAPAARALAKPPVFLAHSDLSGLSLFEEAHYRGVLAAEDAMRHLGHPFETML